MKFSLLGKISASMAGVAVAALFAAAPANAMLLTGQDIIAAPTSVVDDASSGGAENDHQQGFDEQQGYTLLADLAIDGGGVISAGTVVNSHMIFLNSAGSTEIADYDVEWTFSGDVLGVMSDRWGNLEANSSFLGAAGTIYPGNFKNRGMENSYDGYDILGNMLTVDMYVTEPGDWIRVITAVPLPAAFPLYAAGIALLGFLGWRRRNIAA